MARTKKTLTSGTSFDLNKVNPAGTFYYEATLTGNFASARTHSTSSSAGDKLVVTGNNSTLYGGAGPDTLQIAVNPAKPSVTGNNDWLIAGVGANTLIGSNSTVTGAADTLVGNGRSSLVGGSVNNTFILNTNGDKISLGLYAGKVNSIRTSLNNFSLADTLARGTGVANVNNLIYTGNGPSTLVGNDRNGSLVGSSLYGNNLVAGTGIQTLVGSNSALVGDRLTGNGRSSLIGGLGNDTYVLNTPGDKVFDAANQPLQKPVVIPANTPFPLAVTISSFSFTFLSLNTTLRVGTVVTAGSVLNGVQQTTTTTLQAPATITGISYLWAGSVLPAGTILLSNYTIPAGTILSGGNDSILTRIPSLSLTDTLTYGPGILGVENVTFNDGGTLTSGIVTLGGNTLDNNIIGARNTSNFLSGGSGRDFLQGGGSNDTLVGNRFSTLNGGGGSNTYYVVSQQDVVLDSGTESSIIGGNSGSYPFVYDLSLTDGVSGISYLAYTGNAPSTLTGNTQRNTILGGTGNNTITGGSQGNSFLVGNALDDVIIANLSDNTLDAGNGSDLLVVASGSDLANDSIAGGEGSDTLLISVASSLADSAFSGVSSVDALFLTSDSLGASYASLGQAAQDAGITTIVGGSGADSIDVTDFTSAVTIDVSGNQSGTALLRGSGSAPTTFVMDGPGALSTSTVSGGNSVDTLSLISEGSLQDSVFGNVSNIEFLGLAGDSDITLSASAQQAGILTVKGGDGDGTITQDSLSTAALYLDGRDSNTNLFLLASSSQFSGNLDTIVGGIYNDSLSLATDAQIQDADFTNILSVEALNLTGASGVTLGSAAQTAGISTVVGGTGSSSFTQTAENVQSILFNGSASSSNLFVVAASDQNAPLQDTFLGSAGGDTISFTAPASLGDGFFKNVISVENLSLTGNSAVTLGSFAQTTGMQTVSAAYGTAKFVQLATDTLGLSLDGSNAYGALFSIPSSGSLSIDTLKGTGAFDDSLLISGVDTNIADASFANLSSIEVVSLTGASRITLDTNAAAAGFSTVFGGATASTLVQGSGNLNSLTLVGGIGNDLISVATGAQLLADSVVGGQSADTLQIVAPVTLTDDNFGAAISGMEVLLVSGGSSVTAAARAQAKGVSTLGGSGVLSIDASGYSSNVTFLVTDTGIASDTLAGGLGSANQLILAASGAYADTSFTNITSVQSVSVAGGASTAVTLGSSALTTGISTLAVGTASSGTFGGALIQDAAFTAPLNMIGGGSNDFLSVATQAQLLNNTLYGGSGTADTLNVVGALSAFDDSLSAVSGVEILSLSGTGNSISLGANSKNAGLTAVLGGNGGSTLTELTSFGNSSALTLAGGSGADFISISSQAQLLLDSVAGGTGSDTLEIVGALASFNDSFGKISGMDVLSLGGTANSLTLNSAAQNAGIASVFGGNARNTLAVGSSFTSPLTLTGGTDNDLFSLATQAQLLADSIIGNGGINTLLVTGAVTGLNDSFTGVAGINFLNLAGTANSVSLGANAQTTGIISLQGGNSGNTITQLLANTLPLYFSGGTGSDSFVINNQSQYVLDTIVGGLGRDTVQVGSLNSIFNDSFTNLTAVEVLSLGSTANTLSAGANALTAGISAILGGNGGNTLTQTSAFTNALTLSGGTQADLITVSTQAQFTLDSIAGGTGSDTLLITGTTSINDLFSRVSGIEVLSLQGAGSAVTLGGGALTTGITSVFGGIAGNSLTQVSGYGNNALTLNGGAGNDYFTVGTLAQLTADSIIGAGGIDTLQITANSAVVDASFARTSGIEALVLTGASTAVLGNNAQTNGIATVVGGTASNTLSSAAYTTLSTQLNNAASTVISGVYGGASTDTLIGGRVADSLQGWSGNAAANTASDTLTGGSGADLFIMAVTGSTNNAYGKGGADTTRASITDFAAGAGADRIQLRQFGAGAADYSTLLSGSVLDIYHGAQTTNNLVAQMTLASGTFSFANNAIFI